MTLAISEFHVPDLIRDLHLNLRFFKDDATSSPYGALRLHHGLTSGRGALHWTYRSAATTGRSPSARAIGTYCQVQNQNAGVVRSPRQFRSQSDTRTPDQTLAARLEKRVDPQNQPPLARHNTPHRQLRWRSRVKPGTRPIFCFPRGPRK